MSPERNRLASLSKWSISSGSTGMMTFGKNRLSADVVMVPPYCLKNKTPLFVLASGAAPESNFGYPYASRQHPLLTKTVTIMTLV